MVRLIVLLPIIVAVGCGNQQQFGTDAKSVAEKNADSVSDQQASESPAAARSNPLTSMPPPETASGKVMKVIDGDTIFFMNKYRKTMTVQLKGVDAPEIPQAYGQTARQKLAERIAGKIITVVFNKEDEFGRRTGEVYEAKESINVWLIQNGCGWHNWKFDSDPKKVAAEKEARSAKVGLWSQNSPVAPWVWKNPPDDGKIYVQGDGTRYHRSNCRTLDNRRKEVSLAEVLLTHTPCRICNPPTK